MIRIKFHIKITTSIKIIKKFLETSSISFFIYSLKFLRSSHISIKTKCFTLKSKKLDKLQKSDKEIRSNLLKNGMTMKKLVKVNMLNNQNRKPHKIYSKILYLFKSERKRDKDIFALFLNIQSASRSLWTYN